MALPTTERRLIGRGWSTLRTPVGWTIGLLALYLTGRNTDWEATRQRLLGLDLVLSFVAIVLALVVVYAKSVRWSLLVRSGANATSTNHAGAQPLGGLDLFPIVLAGQLVNNSLPLRLGEVVRIEALAGRRVPRLVGASTVVVEKLCDGFALAVFAALLTVVVPWPTWLNRAAILIGVAGAVLLVVGALGVQRFLSAIARREGRVARLLATVMAGLLALRTPTVAANVGGWTLASWVVGLVVNYAALRASGTLPSLGLVLLVTVGGYAGGILPSPPGRLGVFQYVCIVAAEAFGVDHATALVFATVEYVAVVVVPSALGGLSLVLGMVGMPSSTGSLRGS